MFLRAETSYVSDIQAWLNVQVETDPGKEAPRDKFLSHEIIHSHSLGTKDLCKYFPGAADPANLMVAEQCW